MKCITPQTGWEWQELAEWWKKEAEKGSGDGGTLAGRIMSAGQGPGMDPFSPSQDEFFHGGLPELDSLPYQQVQQSPGQVDELRFV